MGRPREHDESTREALLAAAEQQLSRGEPLSVRRVAEAVGTTTRAVYSVFGSMEGLHHALIARSFDEIRVRVEAMPMTDDPLADLVRAGVEGFRRYALERPNLFRLAFTSLLPDVRDTPDVQFIKRASILALHARVKRCCEAGLFGTRPAREVTWLCNAFCQGLASVELSGWFPPDSDPERLWRDGLTAFVEGLRADRQPQRRPAKKRAVRSGSGRSGTSR